MPNRITSTSHQWLGAACVSLDPAQAKTADRLESLRLPGTHPTPDDPDAGKIRVVEVYCSAPQCAGAYEDVSSDPCPGTDDAVHEWIGAVLVPLDDEQSMTAVRDHAVTLHGRLTFDVIDTYCDACRRGYVDVADTVCEAAASNEHLRGGPIGVRAKRKHVHDCERVGCPGPPGSRQGDVAAVI